MSVPQIVVIILGGITIMALVVFALAMMVMAKDADERADLMEAGAREQEAAGSDDQRAA